MRVWLLALFASFALAAIPQDDQEIAELFRKMDVNGDFRISRQEIAEYFPQVALSTFTRGMDSAKFYLQ
jgi:hypothetical protein